VKRAVKDANKAKEVAKKATKDANIVASGLREVCWAGKAYYE